MQDISTWDKCILEAYVEYPGFKAIRKEPIENG